MLDSNPLVAAVFDGWHFYQQQLIEALRPLTDEQLQVGVGPDLRTVGQIATHIVSVRAGWFFFDLKEGGPAFEELDGWQWSEQRRSAAELVQGLEATWAGMQAIMGRWTPEQWAESWANEDEYGPRTLSRPWVIWHLIEHDLHHGGEIHLALGANGIPTPDM